MKTTSKKIFLFMMLAILLAPAAISAKVYFLEAEDESAGALNLVIPCRLNYPLTSCSDGKVPQNYCPTDNRYFQTCGCDSTVYQYDSTNCTGNKNLAGTACDGKYASCSCDAAKYMYDSTNCGDGKVLGGNSCDGKYETCGCDSTYSKTCSLPMVGSGSACDGKYQLCTCPSGYLTCDNGGAAGATSCTEEDGTVKYSSCKTMTCEDHGYVSSYHPSYNPAELDYSYTTVYIDGLTCYEESVNKCSAGGYVNSVPSGQNCIPVTYNGRLCYRDCIDTCEVGGYVNSVPSGQTCTQVAYSGQTCYKDCKSTTCEALVKANYPDLYDMTFFTTKTVFLSNTISKIYGPHYYPYAECQAMETPTITVSNTKLTNVSEISDINIVFTSDGKVTTYNDSTIYNSCLNAFSNCRWKYQEDDWDLAQEVRLYNFEQCSYQYTSNLHTLSGTYKSEYSIGLYPCTPNDDGDFEEECCKNTITRTGIISNGGQNTLVIRNAEIDTKNLGYLVVASANPFTSITLEGTVKLDKSLANIASSIGNTGAKKYIVKSGASVTLGTDSYTGIYVWGEAATLTVESGATLTLPFRIAVSGNVNKNSDGVYLYGTIKTEQLDLSSDYIHVYSGGKLIADKIYFNQSYKGAIKYYSGGYISIGGVCKKITSTGSFFKASSEWWYTQNELPGTITTCN